MKIIAFFGFFIAGFLPQILHAQDSSSEKKKTLQHSIPEKVLHDKRDKIVTLVIENDSIGGRGTDEHYTSGVRLSFFDVNAEIPDFANVLADNVPTIDINETSSFFYSIGQNIYTPSDITKSQDQPDDRPWAAHLYGSIALLTVTDNHLDQIEFSLGLIGPYAFGEEAQTFIHKLTPDAPEPEGWDNQLDTEPTLGLGWVRRYPDYASMRVGDLLLAAEPYYGVTLGNVNTFANTGFHVRLVPSSELWQDNPARVRPGLPGTGFFEIPDERKNWSWYLFGGLEGRAVARNIFLDGNTFTDSPSVDKNHFVADANAGLALTYKQYRLSYTLVYRTREFENQDDAALFGALSLGYRF